MAFGPSYRVKTALIDLNFVPLRVRGLQGIRYVRRRNANVDSGVFLASANPPFDRQDEIAKLFFGYTNRDRTSRRFRARGHDESWWQDCPAALPFANPRLPGKAARSPRRELEPLPRLCGRCGRQAKALLAMDWPNPRWGRAPGRRHRRLSCRGICHSYL